MTIPSVTIQFHVILKIFLSNKVYLNIFKCKSIPFMQSIDVMIFLYGCCSISCCCCCSRMVWLPQKQCSERSHTIVDILFGVSEMQQESFFSSHIGYFGWQGISLVYAFKGFCIQESMSKSQKFDKRANISCVYTNQKNAFIRLGIWNLCPIILPFLMRKCIKTRKCIN